MSFSKSYPLHIQAVRLAQGVKRRGLMQAFFTRRAYDLRGRIDTEFLEKIKWCSFSDSVLQMKIRDALIRNDPAYPQLKRMCKDKLLEHESTPAGLAHPVLESERVREVKRIQSIGRD